MILPIIGAAIATGILLYYFLRNRKKQKEEEEKKNNKAEKTQENRNKNWDSPDTTIEKVVNKISFSKVKEKVKQKKIGTKQVETKFPTEEITIRPLQGLQEIPSVLISQHAYDDDLFFSKLASQQLLTKQYTIDEDVFESNIIKPIKLVKILLDVSGSMFENENHHRIAWAFKCIKAILQKCKKEKVVTHIIVFSDTIKQEIIVLESEKEYDALINNLKNSITLGGGTNIDLPLDVAIEGYKMLENYQDAQIVLITDGTEGINTSKTLNGLKEGKIKLFTICIDVSHPQLQSISNTYFNVTF